MFMAYGRDPIGEPAVVAVEGKADEVFASRPATRARGNRGVWIRGEAIRAIEFLEFRA